jgi:hypothetical protein
MGEFLVLLDMENIGKVDPDVIIGDNAGSPSSFILDMSYFWFHVLFCLGRSDLQDLVKVLSSSLKPTFGYGLGCHGPDHIRCRQPQKRESVRPEDVLPHVIGIRRGKCGLFLGE